MRDRRKETDKNPHDEPPLVGATAVLPLDVFASGSRARVTFKFPSCCCDRQRVEKIRAPQGGYFSFDSHRKLIQDGTKREPLQFDTKHTDEGSRGEAELAER